MAYARPPITTSCPLPGHEAHPLAPLIASTYTTSSITFFLNGQRTILNSPDPRWTLLDFLRSRPGLRGTKLGCGEGGCGACTVVMQIGEHEPRSKGRRIRHLSINACLFPLIGCDGKHVITVEGIGTVGNPHPLQARLAKMHGSQCGFCTPGIVMSLYALIRNAWDPEGQVFRLSEREVEMDGALDGNLCRCTGYKTILEAAKTFVTEDLKGRIDSISSNGSSKSGAEENSDDEVTTLADSMDSIGMSSCGRPGGCCRDGNSHAACNSGSVSSNESLERITSGSSSKDSSTGNQPTLSSSSSVDMEEKSPSPHNERPAQSPTSRNTNADSEALGQYDPGTELIYPPSLWHHSPKATCYGDGTTLWFRPTTLTQLVDLKSAYPLAKLVSGSSEVTIEQRLKDAEHSVLVYVGDMADLQGSNLPSSTADEAEWQSLVEVTISGNMGLSDVERICIEGSSELGQRGTVLSALRKQLRYFGGRQIRNVATLAGNIATASPISDVLPVLFAAGAHVTIASLKSDSGEMTTQDVKISDFINGYRKTILTGAMQDGIITAVRIPLTPECAAGREVMKAYKQSKRKEDDIAIVTAAFRILLDANGLVEQAAFAYGGMAPTTVFASKSQQMLLGRRWSDQSTLTAALDCLESEMRLSYDVPGGMAQYRSTLTCSLFLRFWHESLPDLNIVNDVAAPISFAEIERGLSGGTRDMPLLSLNSDATTASSVGKPIPHLSALAQTTGMAEYVDDIPPQHGELFGGLVLSTHAHARILSVDWTPAISLPGVVGYIDRHSLSSRDMNRWGSQIHDEPFFAEEEVDSHGQVIGMVVAESQLDARLAARKVKVDYDDLPAIITIDEAISAQSLFKYGKELRKGEFALKGNMTELLQKCDHMFEGTTRIGGQEQFYLETNAALAIPKSEDGQMDVWSSTQNT